MTRVFWVVHSQEDNSMGIQVVAREIRHKCENRQEVFLYYRLAAGHEPTAKEVRQAINLQDAEITAYLRKAPFSWEQDPEDQIYEVLLVPPCTTGRQFHQNRSSYIRDITEEAYFNHYVEPTLPYKVLTLAGGVIDYPPGVIGYNKDQIIMRFRGGFEGLLLRLFKKCLPEDYVWETRSEDTICTMPTAGVELSIPSRTGHPILSFIGRDGKAILVWHETIFRDHLHINAKILDKTGKDVLARTEREVDFANKLDDLVNLFVL